jgi:hypothetical protein
MRINSITVDDFYTNPWQVREFALNQQFAVRGNYPGQRTVSFLTIVLNKLYKELLNLMLAKSPIGVKINIQDHSNIPLQPTDLGFMQTQQLIGQEFVI